MTPCGNEASPAHWVPVAQPIGATEVKWIRLYSLIVDYDLLWLSHEAKVSYLP
jgi:hypothetical protein